MNCISCWFYKYELKLPTLDIMNSAISLPFPGNGSFYFIFNFSKDPFDADKYF